jgi:hypothetical protein
VGVNPPSVDIRLLGLLAHIPVCNRYIQFLLTKTNPSVFNRHRQGLQPWRCHFPHTTPRPSQPMVSSFHLRSPPNLQFNQALPNVPKFKFKEPMASTWSSDHSAIYRNLQLRLAIANNLSLAIGSTRIVQKEILMQVRYQSNSYNLMHNQES